MKPPLKGFSYSNDFQTPPSALRPLLPFLSKHWVIWECACGKGNLSNALIEHGYEVIATDILTGMDFLKDSIPGANCILTNPPYALKQAFLERAYYLSKPFALLLPLTTLETPKRQSLFKKHGVEIILFDRRINFETPDGKGSGSWFAVAWFTWGLKIGKELNFVKYDSSPMQQEKMFRKE